MAVKPAHETPTKPGVSGELPGGSSINESQSFVAPTQVFDAAIDQQKSQPQSQTFVMATQVFEQAARSENLAVVSESRGQASGLSQSDLQATQVFDHGMNIGGKGQRAPRASDSLTDIGMLATQVFEPPQTAGGSHAGGPGKNDDLGETQTVVDGRGLELSDIAATQVFEAPATRRSGSMGAPESTSQQRLPASDRSRMSFSPHTCSTQVMTVSCGEAAAAALGFPHLALDISTGNDASRNDESPRPPTSEATLPAGENLEKLTEKAVSLAQAAPRKLCNCRRRASAADQEAAEKHSSLTTNPEENESTAKSTKHAATVDRSKEKEAATTEFNEEKESDAGVLETKAAEEDIVPKSRRLSSRGNRGQHKLRDDQEAPESMHPTHGGSW